MGFSGTDWGLGGSPQKRSATRVLCNVASEFPRKFLAWVTTDGIPYLRALSTLTKL